ncbi:MAG: GNAT family N-acetyltransferase [Thermomicrobiales bacterium]|nr:GNAT family N-acetyltransferase [Thermomicrobiales bacterium]
MSGAMPAQPGDPAGPVRVAAVGPDAADLVHRLTRAAFAEYAGVLEPPPGTLFETVADVAAAIAAGAAAIAWDGERAVGAARLLPCADRLSIARLAVPPAQRGRGVGSALLTFAHDRARALGLPEARVEVRAALPGNVAFFHRHGYTEIARRPHPRLPAAEIIVMAKRIAPAG